MSAHRLLIIAGTSGVGKSTLSARVASSLGFSKIVSTDTIRETRPVVPMEVFPEVRGFTKMEHGIMSVLNTSREVPVYRSWVSGAPVMLHNGSLVDDTFSGSDRYTMQPMWM